MKATILSPGRILELAPQWELLVKQNPASGFMQSLAWAQFKIEQGLQPVHIALIEDGTICGGAIFYHVPNNKSASLLIAPDGPILPWQHQRKAETGLNLIRACVEDYCREHNVIAMRIEPRLTAHTPVISDFGKAPLDLNPRETLVLSLEPSADELLGSFKNKCRYNIRLSERKGVHVYEETAVDAVPKFHRVMREAASRDHFTVEPVSFFQKLIRSLADQNMAKLLFAEHEGDVLGALLMIQYGDRATYLYGGISNNKRNLMAGYALQWQAMLLAQNAGCTSYDFYGLDEIESPSHPYARFSRFKKSFGGEVVRTIGAHDYFFIECLADAVLSAILEVPWTDADEPPCPKQLQHAAC